MTKKIILENQSSLIKKVKASVIAGLTVAALLLVIGNGGNVFWFPPLVAFTLVAISVITSLVFPFIWHKLEKKQKINSTKAYGILYSIIRYGISINIASFGWKKIFGLQFIVPNEIANQPMNRQNGEWLTWYYFGFSNTFGLIIAFIQIVGAYLLLFRRTLLLGSIILFSLMFNLCLINIFYNMNVGALLQSLVLTIGITFLISLDYNKLKAFLFNDNPTLPTIPITQNTIRNIYRISAIIISLLFTIYLRTLLKP